MDTRFYCDKCGKDVAFNTEICPYCGEVFNAVKCPVCKLIGKPRLFINGCPSCGFMHPKQEIHQESPQQLNLRKNTVAIRKKKQSIKPVRKKRWLNLNISPTGYKILILVFILVLIGLLYMIYRLYA